MSLRSYQSEIDAWIQQFEEGYWPPLANLARLTEEVGEFAREVNHRFGPKKRKASESDRELAEEMGDILFTIMVMANSLDIDLDEVMDATLQKVVRRDSSRWKLKPGVSLESVEAMRDGESNSVVADDESEPRG